MNWNQSKLFNKRAKCLDMKTYNSGAYMIKKFCGIFILRFLKYESKISKHEINYKKLNCILIA